MTDVTVTPGSAWVSTNLTASRVKAIVSANADTIVDVGNAAASATVKVCKFSLSPALQGASYSFTVNGAPVQAKAGTKLTDVQCSQTVSTFPGTRLRVQENVPANETVAQVWFNGTANANKIANTAGLAKATAAAGANVFYFEDEPIGPPQTGYLEICKDHGDVFVLHMTDPFVFTVTDKTNVPFQVSVNVDQCSGPIKVAAGNVTVEETQGTQTKVTKISTFPDANALGANNLTNGTATVVVPVSDTSTGEVQLHFENSTLAATVKICKYLTTGSDALSGKTFTFTW